MKTLYLYLLSPGWSLFLFLGHSLHILIFLPKHAKACSCWVFKSPLYLVWDRWWLLLFTNLTWLGGTRIAISECIFLEVITIWFSRLSKDIHFHQCRRHHPIHWGPKWNKMQRKGEFFLFSWAGKPIFSCSQRLELLVLGSLISD